MEEGLYTVRLLFTKLSPPATHGFIPRIRKRKLLEKLKKYGVTEHDVNRARCDDGSYALWIGQGYLLEIRPAKRSRFPPP